MLKVQPQEGPQVKPAVPVPLALSVLTVNVLPVLTLRSVHGEPCVTCDVMVALVAEPVPFSVKVTSKEFSPHPVFPSSVICHPPDKSAFVIVPTLALLRFTTAITVSRDNAT